MMRPLGVLLLACVASVVPVTAGAANEAPTPASVIRDAIAAAVTAKVGDTSVLDIQLLQALPELQEPLTTTVPPGARFGTPSRFVIVGADGRRVSVLVRISAAATRVIAKRPLLRDADVTDADVEAVEGTLEGQAVDVLPTLAQVVGSRPRRAVAAGEVLTGTIVHRPAAIRAGDAVTLTVRSGAIEVRGSGRAASSGMVGDIIRVLRPGNPQPARARVVAPDLVEIVQ